MFIFFVCTGKSAIKHRTSCGCTEVTCKTSLRWNNCPELWCTEVCSMFWKFKWIIFSLLWTDWFDLHMQLGPVSSLVHKSKLFKRTELISEPSVVNFINSDWLQQSAKTCPHQVGQWIFSQQQIIVKYYQVSYKKCSWSNSLRNQQRYCMSGCLCIIIHQSR